MFDTQLAKWHIYGTTKVCHL